jgi:hypothetical protein
MNRKLSELKSHLDGTCGKSFGTLRALPGLVVAILKAAPACDRIVCPACRAVVWDATGSKPTDADGPAGLVFLDTHENEARVPIACGLRPELVHVAGAPNDHMNIVEAILARVWPVENLRIALPRSTSEQRSKIVRVMRARGYEAAATDSGIHLLSGP